MTADDDRDERYQYDTEEDADEARVVPLLLRERWVDDWLAVCKLLSLRTRVNPPCRGLMNHRRLFSAASADSALVERLLLSTSNSWFGCMRERMMLTECPTLS